MQKYLSGLILAIGLGASAHAHPHPDPKPKKTEKTWPYFGDDSEDAETDSDARLPKALSELRTHFKKHGEKMRRDMDAARKKHKDAMAELHDKPDLSDTEDIREAARALEDMLAESDILENMAEMVMELADDIEIDKGDDGMSLRFNGETLGRFNLEREGRLSDTLSMEGLGKNMVIDKETFIEDGKKRTRIVIEMDEGDDLEIEVKPKSKKN